MWKFCQWPTDFDKRKKKMVVHWVYGNVGYALKVKEQENII